MCNIIDIKWRPKNSRPVRAPIIAKPLPANSFAHPINKFPAVKSAGAQPPAEVGS